MALPILLLLVLTFLIAGALIVTDRLNRREGVPPHRPHARDSRDPNAPSSWWRG